MNFFLELYKEQDGQEGRANWAADEKLTKLKDFAEARLAELN